MQKVLDSNTAMKYLSGERNTITGLVAKFADTQNLKTYTEVYNGLRLDYSGTTFVDPGTEGATMYAIRFASDETASKVVKSVRSDELGNAGWLYPYTGTGFISSALELDMTTPKPCNVLQEGTTLIPEYIARVVDDTGVALRDGAEMYIIGESGEEILYAVFDASPNRNCFVRIGE